MPTKQKKQKMPQKKQNEPPNDTAPVIHHFSFFAQAPGLLQTFFFFSLSHFTLACAAGDESPDLSVPSVCRHLNWLDCIRHPAFWYTEHAPIPLVQT